MVQGVEVEKRKGNIKKPSVIPRPVLRLVVGIRSLNNAVEIQMDATAA
mgnify:CR=1 FL=1